jgi:hypothetical protein
MPEAVKTAARELAATGIQRQVTRAGNPLAALDEGPRLALATESERL